MAREPRDGGGTGSSEKELEDAFWATMSSTQATMASQGGTNLNTGPNYEQTPSVSSSIWSFPNIYTLSPMTPISQFLMQDVPSMPLPYSSDTWHAPSTASAPTHASNLSSLSTIDYSSFMSFTQCLQEGMSMGSTLSSFSDHLISRQSTSALTYTSASGSSPLKLKQEQQEEMMTGIPSTSYDVARFPSSSFPEFMQDIAATPSSSSPLRGLNVSDYPSPANVGYGDQAISSMSSSSSDGGHDQEATEEATKAGSAGAAMEAPDEKGGISAAAAEEIKSPASDQDHPSAASADKPPPTKQSSGKARKKGQKRHREARVALVTKSEVEHLEDGFRWRKYGQKAVKNSPYPRSYYRCTNSKCTLKKRVERSPQDPTMVITTYEGQHNHHSPAVLRGSAESHYAAAAAAAATFNLGPFSTSPAPPRPNLLSTPPPHSFSFPPFPPLPLHLPRSSYELAMQLQAQDLPPLPNPPPLLSNLSSSLLNPPPTFSSLHTSSLNTSLPYSNPSFANLTPSFLSPTSPFSSPNLNPSNPTFSSPNLNPSNPTFANPNPTFGNPPSSSPPPNFANPNPTFVSSSSSFSASPSLSSPNPSFNPTSQSGNPNPTFNPTSQSGNPIQDLQQSRALLDAALLHDLLFPPKP